MNMNFLQKKKRILTLLRHFYSYRSFIPNRASFRPQTASKSDFTAFGTSWQPRSFQSGRCIPCGSEEKEKSTAGAMLLIQ
ncbi:hypothetical protein HOLDEFILI_01389 [Holdemania filiformis DSM 12042]|uniref:Uncharacterized protein n=1 Tax=Holdemania filiformis DSM 12042 TaxID=545696 RepID=B9Y6F7_9FIRM|nr:hypothetical protein HOLDEFILI_01389 [Holdemania filiformis DSM 12042]